MENLGIDIKKEVFSGPLDLRAEVAYSEVVDKGIAPDAIYVKPLGTLKRPFQKDIADVYEAPASDWTSEEKLIFEVNREGIYDALPEAFFHSHSAGSKSAGQTKEDLIKDYNEGKSEELHARKFFLPIEAEFFFQRFQIEDEERKSVFGFMNPRNQKMFFDFWGLPDLFTKEQLYILLKILPFAYHLKGNLIFVGQILTALFKKPCEVTVRGSQKIEEQDVQILGETLLGMDSILSGDFHDGDPSLCIILRDISKSELDKFLPGSKNDEIMDCIIRYFLPASAFVTKSIVLPESEKFFYTSVNPEQKDHADFAYLNFDTFI